MFQLPKPPPRANCVRSSQMVRSVCVLPLMLACILNVTGTSNGIPKRHGWEYGKPSFRRRSDKVVANIGLNSKL
ncbi:hypothetical protein F4806DRAFT_464678 [Annulohypoxylon nitens]|nr:hypothetical protein F4806DRAFT_464678 [Annulohypoxylon nitens]